MRLTEAEYTNPFLTLLTDGLRLVKWSRNEPAVDYSERLAFLYSYPYYSITILKRLEDFHS